MNPQDLIAPLLHQVELLTQVVKESPYLSHEGRKCLEKEILDVSEKLKEGSLTNGEGEKVLIDLDKKTVTDEITSLMTKIGNLNPSSPRLESLRNLAGRLESGEISAKQARLTVHHLMQSALNKPSS